MMQQRTVCKFSEDDHYCSALYRYARELALRYRGFTTFISPDDKNEIKCREPCCPISGVTRGKKVLVASDQVLQSVDHDFAAITLVPTVVMVHDLPPTIDQSWYRGQPYIYVKITATEPSSALRNSIEIENALIKKYATKKNIPPVVIIYTDRGPEHPTNFLSVKIAVIALQKLLNSDMIIALRTAPGHF